MSRQKKQRKSLESTGEHSAAGKPKGSSKQSKRPQDNEDTTCSPIQLELKKFGQQLSTLLVSSRAQQPDLNRQVAALIALYPDAEVISEIGGGLNFRRKKFQALLERVMQGSVRRIIVAHKDRLARFGFDHFQWLCDYYGCEIVVLNETNLSSEGELTQDILAILHCFSSKLYGLRKYKSQMSQDPDLPKS